MFRIFLILVSLFVFTSANAQRKRVETSISAGLTDKVQAVGFGWHGGLNFYARKPKKLKLEVQFSISNTNEKDDPRSYFAINGLAGARYYLLDPTKTAKVYCNALIGPAYNLLFDYDYYYPGTPIGYSAGIFVNNNGFISGLSIENTEILIFKLGYAF